MKVLILGGTGLISTGITRLLLARGDTVTHVNRGQCSQEFAGKVTTATGNRYEYAAFEAQMCEANLRASRADRTPGKQRRHPAGRSPDRWRRRSQAAAKF